jgi:hypothetical protein
VTSPPYRGYRPPTVASVAGSPVGVTRSAGFDGRTRLIVDVLVDAFRTTLRTMTAGPFAFYRGGVCLWLHRVARPTVHL